MVVVVCVCSQFSVCVLGDAQCSGSTACLSAAGWCAGQSHMLRDGSTGHTASTITPLFFKPCQFVREREWERKEQAASSAGHVITSRNKKCWVRPSFDSIWQNLYKCSLLTDFRLPSKHTCRNTHSNTHKLKHSQNSSVTHSVCSVIFLWLVLLLTHSLLTPGL